MVIKGKLKLSASAIKTYEQCPRKYFYTYIEKPGIERQEWPHLKLGNFVHDVLDNFHTTLIKNASHEWPELMSKTCKQLLSKYALEKDQKVAAKEMLKKYLAKLGKNGLPNVLESERRFQVNIDDDIILKGFIDRIDLEEREDGERYHIIDYKTGKSKYLDEFQLLIYGLHLLEANPDLERFKGSYIALAEDCKFISYNFTKTDLDKVIDKVRKVADEIKADQTWQPKPQFLCNYCDFREICPESPHKVAAQGRRDWK